MGPKPTPVQDRFWPKVDKRGPDECWPWLASVTSNGYGKILVNGRLEPAPRVSFVLAHGEIPAGLWVLHRCDNPPCVNPAHLYVGSPEDNNRDRIVRGRFRGNPDPWACKRRLTAEQVEEIRAFGNPHRHARSELAKRYGVTYQHIMAIQRGQRR